MTVAALITEGIGPGSSLLFVMTGGLGSGAAAPQAAVVDEFRKHGASRRANWPPQRFYLPPGWKEKKELPSIEQVKALYVEARKEIPLEAQAGLLPEAFRLRAKGTKKLPAAASVDFEALRRNIEVLQGIVTALAEYDADFAAEQAEAEIIARRRKREEEALIVILLNS